VIGRVLVTVCMGFELSCNLKMTDVVPTVVGTPVMAPVAASSERPGGRAGEPGARLQKYGVMPPDPATTVA